MSVNPPQNTAQNPVIVDIASVQLSQTSIHTNVAQDVIMTTEDKLWRCLHEHLKKVTNKQAWIAPAGIFLSVTITLITASFKDFWLPKATWQAVFVLADFISIVWLVCTLKDAFTRISEQEFIEKVKHGSQIMPKP